MKFNPGPNKQANEIILSCKLVSSNLSHPPVKFNNNNITRFSHQKIWELPQTQILTSTLILIKKLQSAIRC